MFNRSPGTVRGLLGLVSMLCIITMFMGQVESATAGYDKLSSNCKQKLFPISSGGSKDEKVSCTIYDKANQQIIVAGNSTSEDYVPAANDHGFAYAIDLEGNWKWGKFFYNVSFAISTISGCQIDDNGMLLMLGLGDQKPVVMELDPSDGSSITSFVSLDKVGATDTTMPWYKTYAAVHHDVKDVDDG